jgi:hypothetical protein
MKLDEYPILGVALFHFEMQRDGQTQKAVLRNY